MELKGTVRLEFSTGQEPIERLEAVNDVIGKFGARTSPLSTRDSPNAIRSLLSKKTLTPDELEQVKAYFLLPRDKLLEIISAAGREPQVPGGGSLTTHVLPHDYDYPQLYIAEEAVDYGRFERFHVNEAEDGTGVDEILQILWGEGFEAHMRTPDGTILTLRLNCSSNHGWTLTYDGGGPHISTISNASPGTKVLVQVIGAPRWVMKYVD